MISARVLSGRTRLARVYLWRAEQLTPDSPAVVRARNRLRASATRQTRRQAETQAEQQAEDPDQSGSFVDNVVKWFKKSTEDTKPAPKESPTSQNVRKALGGH